MRAWFLAKKVLSSWRLGTVLQRETTSRNRLALIHWSLRLQHTVLTVAQSFVHGIMILSGLERHSRSKKA